LTLFLLFRVGRILVSVKALAPVLLACLALLKAGCASGDVAPGGGIGWVSQPRTERVTHIVVHHTAVGLGESLSILSGRDPARRVSAHYVVTDESPPRVIAIVPEDRVAYHAGVSRWRGRDRLNAVSIGIEIVNPDGNRHAYSESQIAAVATLLEDLIRRHGIDARNVVAHSDVSPGRKVDPGVLFPWEKLHRERGIGTWPAADRLRAELGSGAALPSPDQARSMLGKWGYPVGVGATWEAADRNALEAFQRRYRPSRVDGILDGETTAILRVLLAAYPDSP